MSNVLDDGTYEAIAFDADNDGDTVTVELTIIAGDHKGEVLSIRGDASALGVGDALDLLGVPATVIVTDGRPQVEFET